MDTPEEAPLARLGVMGGTFDPIHLGHLVVACEALHSFRLDRVMFVPTGRPWQKESYSAAEDRYLMTVLGAATNSRFVVSRLELDRTGPTYTADTMEVLRDFHGDQVELFFVAGADAVLKLGTWRRLDRLGELATMIAVTRPGFDLSGLDPRPSWPPVEVMEVPAIGISSSDIRGRIQAGRPIDYLVPHEVARYIRDHGLYVGESHG